MPLHDCTGRLHAAMAGTGNPYAVLTTARLRLLARLHRGELAALPEEDRAPLLAAHLVRAEGGRDRPTFFIADAAETARVDAHALRIGEALAARLLARWGAVAEAYATLAIGRALAFPALAFVLVGDRILDVGLLDALAGAGDLMPPAPARPAPATPDARYYLWLIEGEAAQLGQYGQRTTALPWPGWELLTFGRYTGAAGTNEARDALEARARDLVASGRADGPATLAARLGLPALDRDDARRWGAVERGCTDELVAVYRAYADELRLLYRATRAGASDPAGFGEFFCWYDHLAYAHAIDRLVEIGLVELPAAGFAALLREDDAAGAY